ncbi:GMC oxidoreductase [Acanthamoeba castellanii str. Neff]|uniref:GMC oxidoreductase n=1 Tax=Acanthamoeba castellanii (strain ATCC 30010 / Neff) TaxID=1257118 RepID=L8GM23_ACACF|nr:GMC oxidoreductase [Acanthamoeba castellanii str. Neff]ELR13271.1 GMC oxidoreductase [Acanthamoeba castellanii str. Neff]
MLCTSSFAHGLKKKVIAASAVSTERVGDGRVHVWRATDGRVHVWPRGKVSLKWMLYVRGNPGDYDLWANEFGCTGWSYEEVLPNFRKSEHRGAGGPLVVSDVQAPNTITGTFIAAAQSVGILYNPDMNGGQQLGVGHAQLTIDNGRRCTTAYAFLKPEVQKRPNLTVLVGAHATRVLFDIDRTRAVGVEYKLQSENYKRFHTAYAARTGVGPKQHLREFYIPLIQDMPYVGEQMQDHLFVPVAFSALRLEGLLHGLPYPFLKALGARGSSSSSRPWLAPS